MSPGKSFDSEFMSHLPRSYQPLSVATGIRAATYRNPSKLALRDAEGSRTYAQLMQRIDRVSAGLMAGLGLKPGNHIGILSANRIDYMEVVVGASQVGFPIATINPRLSATEVTAICDDAQARVLFADATCAELARSCQFSTVNRIIEFGSDFEAWLSAANTPLNPPVVPEWDTFTIPYTSGTTGQPKGVLVPHRSRILSFYGMAVEYGCYSPDDRFLALAPLCHGAGLAFSLAIIYFGGYVQLMNQFDPEAVIRQLHEDRMSGVFFVPSHFFSIFSLEKTVLDRYQETNLRAIISNAAPLPQSTKEQIVAYFGDGLLHETYGSTEGGIVSNLRPADQLRKQRCVGLPFTSTFVKVVNEAGVECPADEVGELYSRSPFLFNGYWQKPEETEHAFKEGWVTVGDLARRDEEGYIYIVDRIKDMIISGGINVYPREVEEVLIQHPSVAEVAVIGVPDERWGERLRAYVVLRAGQQLEPAELISHCEGQLARFKVPREFEQLDTLPRNVAGKVLKTDLRKIAASGSK